jgi:hypothetical protein
MALLEAEQIGFKLQGLESRKCPEDEYSGKSAPGAVDLSRY